MSRLRIEEPPSFALLSRGDTSTPTLRAGDKPGGSSCPLPRKACKSHCRAPVNSLKPLFFGLLVVGEVSHTVCCSFSSLDLVKLSMSWAAGTDRDAFHDSPTLHPA